MDGSSCQPFVNGKWRRLEIQGSNHLEFDGALSSRGRDRLRIDLQSVSHVDLYGVLDMAIAVMNASAQGQPITFVPPEWSPSVCNFMSRVGFDDFVAETAGVDCLFPITAHQEERDVRATLRPFAKLSRHARDVRGCL
jgi:hypothetical protein